MNVAPVVSTSSSPGQDVGGGHADARPVAPRE
jgi:hypothetical protein